jgi:peptidyl-dipeptidase A
MFEYEAYLNPNRELNRLYWDLFEQYMLLPRHEDVRPWASLIYYTTHPVYLQNYLYADMIAAQTIDALEDMYGEIVGNESFSSFLNQNYFRFGGRYEWRDLLERGTGERLNPEHLIRRLGIGGRQSAGL